LAYLSLRFILLFILTVSYICDAIISNIRGVSFSAEILMLSAYLKHIFGNSQTCHNPG